jgi:threonine dehydratase
MSSVALAEITAAADRIAPYILRTPLLPSPVLSDLLDTNVYLKYELLQAAGSFKPRGAFNKILGLDDDERYRGLLAVSGGNHGRGVAHAARRLNLRALILMPESAAPSAVAAARADGAEVRLMPNVAAAFAQARELQTQGLTYIHPFDDPVVVAGQGTIGLEILADCPQVTDVIASIGGGGMIGGVAAAIKAQRPKVHIWGVETIGADAMSQALAAGHIVTLPAITSVATTLGAPAVCDLTLDLARRYIEQVLVLPDESAMADLIWLLDQAKVLAEPAAAVTLSAARRLKGQFGPDRHVVLILCGSSISVEELDGLRERFGV